MTTIEEKWLFIGTDRRLLESSNLLKGRGFQAIHFNGNGFTDELAKLINEFTPTRIVFPVMQMKDSIPVGLFRKDAILFHGVASEDWLAPYKEAGLTLKPYLTEVEFIWENAKLTAEGFLIDYYASEKRRISGEHFYVAGFGRVGKMTAAALSSLGAIVTILARSADQLGEAATLGYRTQKFEAGLAGVGGPLINTIPAKWLHPDDAAKFRVFDLASAPGCLKDNAPVEYYTIHLGLPGKHFPVDAAKALTAALLRMNSR